MRKRIPNRPCQKSCRRSSSCHPSSNSPYFGSFNASVFTPPLANEPSLGLAPNIVDQTFDIIRGIRDAGTTVLLVEQNAFAALEMCDHAYLLESGRVVLSGKGAELIENEHVRRAYLGG